MTCVAYGSLLVAACGTVHPMGAQTPVIPWISTVAGPPPAPTPANTTTNLPACHAADLSVQSGRVGLGAGTTYKSFVLAARAHASCSLDGFPAVHLLDAKGGSVLVPVSSMGDTATPVELGGARQAVLTFGWSTTMCVSDPIASALVQWRGAFGALTVALPIHAYTAPGCFPPQLFVAPFADAVQKPEKIPQPDFTVAYELPVSVSAGQILKYDVTLTNVSGHAITFSTCPGYTEALKRAQLVERYVLNCRPVGSVRAGASVTFAMEFQHASSVASNEQPGQPDPLSWVVDRPFVSVNANGPGAILFKAP